jgi:hypothetical protein
MSWLRNNPLLGVLAALAIILAVVIGLEGEFGANVGSVLRPGAATRTAPANAKLFPALVAVAPEIAYPETAARPLFTPTRRPAPEAPAGAQSTFQKGQFVLQGVIAVGDNRVAMLREKSSGRIFRVERGKELNGIKVVDIQTETVTLAQGAEEEKLSLNVQKAPPASPVAAAQAAQAAAQAAQAPQGPFAATPAPGTPAAAAPPVAPATPPVAAAPLFGPRPMPVQPNASQPDAASNPNPAARTATDAATTPMTPEELLARRRARRTQQSQ